MKRGAILPYLKSPEGRQANTLDMIYGVASGLYYLHSRDVIHGDIKSNNILIGEGEIPKICDFGLSDLKADVDRRTRGVSPPEGTMRWMAPELLLCDARHEKKSFASDGKLVYYTAPL